MPQIGGKPKVSKTTKTLKKKSSSSTTKRHFTVVIGSKEHGLYVSSSPSSAARKAVSKLCATDKKRKVQFHIREITQKSEKKTYGPYLGYIEKLAKPIELKGRVIKYKPVAKLSGKTVVKKRGMIGGDELYIGRAKLPYFEIITDITLKENLKKIFNIYTLILYKYQECCISTHDPQPNVVDTKTGFKIYFMFSECVTLELLDKFSLDRDFKVKLTRYLTFYKISKVLIKLYIPIPYQGNTFNRILYHGIEVFRHGEISEEVNIKNINNIYPKYLLSWGIEVLTLERCKYNFMLFILHFMRYFQEGKKIISVGSGNAFFELTMINFIFNERNLMLDIVCIDPNPAEFTPRIPNNYYKTLRNTFIKNKKIFIQPKFHTVKMLISSDGSIVENCFLMLIWPDPYIGYDIEAIHLLKPIGIYIIYTIPPDIDDIRLSGSLGLINFLNGSNTINGLSYKLVYEYNLERYSVAVFEKNET